MLICFDFTGASASGFSFREYFQDFPNFDRKGLVSWWFSLKHLQPSQFRTMSSPRSSNVANVATRPPCPAPVHRCCRWCGCPRRRPRSWNEHIWRRRWWPWSNWCRTSQKRPFGEIQDVKMAGFRMAPQFLLGSANSDFFFVLIPAIKNPQLKTKVHEFQVEPLGCRPARSLSVLSCIISYHFHLTDSQTAVFDKTCPASLSVSLFCPLLQRFQQVSSFFLAVPAIPLICCLFQLFCTFPFSSFCEVYFQDGCFATSKVATRILATSQSYIHASCKPFIMSSIFHG